jgi:hypothetical protein
MNDESRTQIAAKYDTGFLARVLVFTSAYGVIGATFPLQQGELTTAYILGTLVTGFLYSLLLSSILTQVNIGRKGRVLSVWGAIYVVQFFSPLIEGYFFTDQFEDATLFVGGALFGALLAFLYALIAGLLFGSKSSSSSLPDELRSHFSQRKASSWIWRLVVSALCWPVFYFVFGAMVAPVVTPYYTELGLFLVLPPLEVIMSVQALRGFIYVGALLPVIACLKIGMKRLFLLITGLLYIGGGLAIFIIVETFPVMLRIAHGFGDLLSASIFFGIVTAYLVGVPKRE